MRPQRVASVGIGKGAAACCFPNQGKSCEISDRRSFPSRPGSRESSTESLVPRAGAVEASQCLIDLALHRAPLRPLAQFARLRSERPLAVVDVELMPVALDARRRALPCRTLVRPLRVVAELGDKVPRPVDGRDSAGFVP